MGVDSVSPLRYPGGKTKTYKDISNIVLGNGIRIYAEPFAGGAGVGLKLLLNNLVDEIILNDLDFHIYIFWKMCLNKTKEFCELIENCDVDIETWKEQKLIYEKYKEYSELEVAFATFFLNRTNVSGVIKGGPIGGLRQTGKYKIAARFNKDRLINQIQTIGKCKKQIKIYNKDANVFLQEQDKKYKGSILFNIDPPYVKRGAWLYQNYFFENDHKILKDTISTLRNKWIVTYDDCNLIRNIYSDYNIRAFSLKYSAGKNKKGDEVVIYNNLDLFNAFLAL